MSDSQPQTGVHASAASSSHPIRFSYKLLSGVPTRDRLGTIVLREVGTGTEVSWHLPLALKIPGIDRLALPVGRRFIDGLLKGGITAAERGGRRFSS
jgi:hypothetical protein